MKWTKENDDELTRLISIGKKHLEISEILNRSISSVRNRCKRLKLAIVYLTEFECKECNNIFIDYLISDRKFCSKSCSNTNSNNNRTHSDETKNKISEKLKRENNPNYLHGKRCMDFIKAPKLHKPLITRICKYCGKDKVTIKRKSICEDCRYDYYQNYRPSCEFNFDINSYKIEFDFDLIKKYGWYSPTNKGNNLNGVSKDHLYSVRDGFINKISVEIISHPANCSLMKHTDNSSKHSNSSISIEELEEKIKIWECKYNTAQKE